jgi:acyl-CoA synthetase (AMP-forming)/AMP-acid ligase II
VSRQVGTVELWGSAVTTEIVRGIPFRSYVDRPRDVARLLKHADRWRDRPHLVQGERVLTFADLRSAVTVKAATLSDAGLARGDRYLLLGFNSPDWIINFWAGITLGAVPVLANAWWSRTDLVDAIDLITPKMVLADDRGARNLPDETSPGPWECPPVSGDVPPATASGEDHGEDDPAVVVFTSGTAGKPKAVVLTHRSLLAGLHMLLDVTRRLPWNVNESTGEPALHTGPMFHIGGVQTLLRAIVVGDTLVMPRGKFDASEAIGLIERWKVARWSAVPTMLTRVLEHPDIHRYDLSTLKSVTAGGAPVHAEFVAALRSGLPGAQPRVATGYGLTENGGQCTAASGKDTGTRPGSCGRPLPLVELRILDADETGTGEVLVKSPTQMIGYIGEQDSPIDGDGWLHTGDLGRIDADGYLWITGRSKDMIIRGGENIAPAAVEQAISKMPGVVESSVFGIPHTDLGEEVVAAVTVIDGKSEERLVAGVRDLLPSFAMPTRWLLHDSPLPTNHAGKIDKVRIRAEYLARYGAEREDHDE